MTGVWPRGAQVRRTTGSSEIPDSSPKTMTALRRRAFLPDPWPVGLHPAGDGLLVALDGTAGGARPPPAPPAAPQRPDLFRGGGAPRLPVQHRSEPVRRPVVTV